MAFESIASHNAADGFSLINLLICFSMEDIVSTLDIIVLTVQCITCKVIKYHNVVSIFCITVILVILY